MTFIIYALILLWLPACLVAFFFIIRPSQRWALFAKRSRSALVLLGVFFGIPIFIAIAAPDSMRVKPGEEDKSPPVATAPTSTAEPKPVAAEADAATSAAAEQLADVSANPQNYLELSGVKVTKGAGGVVLASGVINNAATVAIKSPRLKCYLSKGPEDVGMVSGFVQKTIPAGGQLTFKAVDMGAADGAWDHQVCEIVEAQAVKRG